mgnify:CR=1 FL=1
MIKRRKGCAEIIPFMILVMVFFLIFTIGMVKKERTRNFEYQTIKMIADDIKVNEKLFTVEMNENELIIKRKDK